MSFDYYDEYYDQYIGMQIRGTIGKKFIYQRIGNRQKKYAWFIPPNPNTPAQQKMRFLLGQATYSWHDLTPSQQIAYESLKPKHLIMSGFNYFVSQYIKSFL